MFDFPGRAAGRALPGIAGARLYGRRRRVPWRLCRMPGRNNQAMTDPAQESLFTLAEEAALYPSGRVPDPAVMTEYVTGVHRGWHAIHRADLEYAFGADPRLAAWAVCGALVRVSKHGVYDRAETPVSHDPCPQCAWHVAIATGSTERELLLLAPDDRQAAALARCGVIPLTAVAVCRAILASAEDPADPAVLMQLAAATAHQPGLAVSEACLEGDCAHHPEDLADGQDWRCDYPDAEAVCWACSLRYGSWAGEGEGLLLDECVVPAPCGVLSALTARYGLTGWR